MSTLVLVGPPGVGKSKLGQKAAAQLGYLFYDGDHELNAFLRKTEKIPNGADPVSLKLQSMGDKRFLDFEWYFYRRRFPLHSDAHTGNIIISASGSMPLVQKTVDHFKARGAEILLLTRPIEYIIENCRKRMDGTDRVVGMAEHGSLEAVIEYRKGIYQKIADANLDLGDGSSKKDGIDVIVQSIRCLQAASRYEKSIKQNVQQQLRG